MLEDQYVKQLVVDCLVLVLLGLFVPPYLVLQLLLSNFDPRDWHYVLKWKHCHGQQLEDGILIIHMLRGSSKSTTVSRSSPKPLIPPFLLVAHFHCWVCLVPETASMPFLFLRLHLLVKVSP